MAMANCSICNDQFQKQQQDKNNEQEKIKRKKQFEIFCKTLGFKESEFGSHSPEWNWTPFCDYCEAAISNLSTLASGKKHLQNELNDLQKKLAQKYRQLDEATELIDYIIRDVKGRMFSDKELLPAICNSNSITDAAETVDKHFLQLQPVVEDICGRKKLKANSTVADCTVKLTNFKTKKSVTEEEEKKIPGILEKTEQSTCTLPKTDNNREAMDSSSLKDETTTKIKRGRGRPRLLPVKIKVAQKRGRPKNLNKKVMNISIRRTEMRPGGGRPRGRPRKLNLQSTCYDPFPSIEIKLETEEEPCCYDAKSEAAFNESEVDPLNEIGSENMDEDMVEFAKCLETVAPDNVSLPFIESDSQESLPYVRHSWSSAPSTSTTNPSLSEGIFDFVKAPAPIVPGDENLAPNSNNNNEWMTIIPTNTELNLKDEPFHYALELDE